MKTVLVAVLLFGLAPGPALAGSYTFTTTAEEDAALDHMVGVENARRAALIPPEPTVTRQTYIDQLWARVLRSYGDQKRRAEKRGACDGWAALTAPQKATITALLGGKSPCE